MKSFCLVVLLLFAGCANQCELEVRRMEDRIEQRFILKQDVDHLIEQANAVIGAHAAAIKDLQVKVDAGKK